jgi:hypothetical protein
MNPLVRLEEIEADIAEAERLMTALRLKMAVKRSAGEDTTTDDRRLLKMMQGWMLLQDQRQTAFEADLAKTAPIQEQSVIPFASLLVVVPAPSTTDRSAPALRR